MGLIGKMLGQISSILRRFYSDLRRSEHIYMVLIALAIMIAAIRPVVSYTLLAWIISFLITRIGSLSSIIAAIFLPFIMIFTGQSIEIMCLGGVFSIFVVLRHRLNIARLLSHQEPRVPFPTFKK